MVRRKRAVVSFSGLLDAFEFVSSAHDGEHTAFLCVETGKFYWHSELGDDLEPLPEDIEDPRKYIPIPHKNDLDLGKSLVMQFVAEELPSEGGIRETFSRPGAYARFKDLLRSRGLEQRWFDYESEARQVAIRDWCYRNGVQVDG